MAVLSVGCFVLFSKCIRNIHLVTDIKTTVVAECVSGACNYRISIGVVNLKATGRIGCKKHFKMVAEIVEVGNAIGAGIRHEERDIGSIAGNPARNIDECICNPKNAGIAIEVDGLYNYFATCGGHIAVSIYGGVIEVINARTVGVYISLYGERRGGGLIILHHSAGVGVAAAQQHRCRIMTVEQDYRRDFILRNFLTPRQQQQAD